MAGIEVASVRSARDRHIFLTFPWRVYRDDPLWVPPLLPDRIKAIDPERGIFFKDGIADFFIAWKDGQPAGTFCLAEEKGRTRYRGHAECLYGFVECVDDYAVFEVMFDHAERWAGSHGMTALYGPYNLDREDCRGILVEGRDRPPALYCGHQPAYYPQFFERYGFRKDGDDNVAYAIDMDLASPRLQTLSHVAERVRARHPEFRVRGANFNDRDGEIDRIVYLQNRGLAHFPDHVPFTRAEIESIILPLLDLVDLDLILFAEADGKPAGFFPGVPNFNEILIHLNGLRYPWDYLRAFLHRTHKPKCISIKSIVVSPEYWGTGLALLLFDEMARRAASKGYRWADLSLTGEFNENTRPLALNAGAQVYKKYRFYRKEIG